MQYPLSENDIRDLHPNTSFAIPFAAPEDYAVVFDTPQPQYNSITHFIRGTQPVLAENSTWVKTWEIVELPAEVAQANLEKEKERIQNEILFNTQKRLDSFAKTRNYDGVDSIGKYKDISDEEIALMPEDEQPLVLKFRTECRYLAAVTARTWAKLYLILDEVLAGTRAVPTGYADIEPDLPVLQWPN
jgi:hypothetical protein